MGAIYTYAIDKATGITYVGKSEVQLEPVNNEQLNLPLEVRLEECQVFETMKIVRNVSNLSDSSISKVKSYNSLVIDLYENRMSKMDVIPDNAVVPLENAVIHTLQHRMTEKRR
ncbi:MAG: hypothetical protein ACP5N2_07500 [Candidatus Nanoarchaeia archaeon]